MKIVILSNIIVSVSVALSANEMPVKQTDASCSKEEDITAIKDWLVTIKTEKIAKRLRRDKVDQDSAAGRSNFLRTF